MEANRFDHLTRSVAGSRRGLLAAVAALPFLGGIAAEDAAAKKKKKATFCLKGQTITAPKKKKKSLLSQGATLGACPPPKTCATECGSCDSCDGSTGTCVLDPAKFGDSCGRADQTCGAKGCMCLAGTCPEDETCCSQVCRFTPRDRNNCGGCGIVCAVNQECDGGQCEAIPCDTTEDCPPTTSCDGTVCQP